MRMNSGMNQMERETATIIVNGVSMTFKEYSDMKKKNQTSKRTARRKKMIQMLAPYVKKLVTNVKVLKSAAAYYDNGYRQWGTVCRDEIINHPYIKGPFIKYRMSAYEISDLLVDIDKIGRKNEKDVFQFIEKLSYKVDDAKEHLNQLVKGVMDSRVCDFYKNEKCINETGRRLGLSILMTKALISMGEIQNLIKELDSIASDGVDALDYD